MLRRDEDLFDLGRNAVDIANGDLRLPIGTQIRQRAVLADLCQALGQAMSEVDRHRHESRRFVAGVSEDHALVAGADGVGRIGSLVMLGLV